MLAVTSHAVEGHVSRGFEAVREAFAENFTRRNELGGACCAYYHGEKVVDLWGGIRNKRTGEPWERDTMVLVYSATKGLSAMTLAIAHSRAGSTTKSGSPRTGRNSRSTAKRRSAVRQLLAHQAGLFAFDEPVDRSVVADLDRLALVLARQGRVGARYASGLSRPHARVCEGGVAAARRSAASQPRTVLSRRDRNTSRAGRLHPPAEPSRNRASRH